MIRIALALYHMTRKAHRHEIQIHMYTYDTQMYVSDYVTQTGVISQVENYINDLQSWMVTNKLKPNGSKTELVVLASSLFS